MSASFLSSLGVFPGLGNRQSFEFIRFGSDGRDVPTRFAKNVKLHGRIGELSLPALPRPSLWLQFCEVLSQQHEQKADSQTLTDRLAVLWSIRHGEIPIGAEEMVSSAYKDGAISYIGSNEKEYSPRIRSYIGNVDQKSDADCNVERRECGTLQRIGIRISIT